jgi:hypothetical protein
MVFNSEKFLNTPIFAFDQLGILSSVAEFLTFSEDNIVKQKVVALEDIDKELTGVDEDEIFSYRDHLQTNIEFRFDVALPMRVRYAALTAFTSTVEWSMTILKPKSPISKEPKNTSRTIHLLYAYAERCSMSLDSEIKRLEFLIWVRNSIMHNAGTLKGYKHEQDVRNAIAAYAPGFSISNWHHIGDTVEIKHGTLEPLIKAWAEIIRELYTVATKRKLLVF